MKFFSLLCFIGCALFVNTQSVPDLSKVNKFFKDFIFANRNNFKTGFGGVLPSLDPLEFEHNFPVALNTPNGLMNDTIIRGAFKGLTSFDQVYVQVNLDGSFVSHVHVPEIEFTGLFNSLPVVNGVSGGSFSATLNDVELTIKGDSKMENGIPQVNNIHVKMHSGAPTTNIQIKNELGENILNKDLSSMLEYGIGPLLRQVVEIYQTANSQFVTKYLNDLQNKVLQHQ